MRILIATGIYPPDIGGPATYSKLLADTFPGRGIEVEVLSFGEVRKFPKAARHLMYLFKTLKRGWHADIIFAQDPVSVGLPAMIAAAMVQKRFLLRLGGDYAWEQGVGRYHITDTLDDFSQKNDYPFFVRALKYIQKMVALYAERVIVPSNYLKRIIENWGVPSSKIKVIYNAFAANPLKEDKIILRKKLQLSGTVILSAGRLVPWKGFSTLIATLSMLRHEIPDAKLYIAGDGPERGALELQVANYKEQGDVIFLGRLSHETLREYIKAADVFALNTGYEGFSHQLLEVMAEGVPIVTTPVGGNSELIENGTTGILVEYNSKEGLLDAIKRLTKDVPLRQKIIQNAKERVGIFTQERMLQETVKQLQP